MRNREVIQAWNAGRKGVNGTETLSTDGVRLWSYALLIGDTATTGERFVYGYRGSDSVSQTTSCHVGLALRVGTEVVVPRRKTERYCG